MPSRSPEDIAAEITFRRERLSFHPDDIPPEARVVHERALDALPDPHAVQFAEIDRRLSQPLSGPERALLEEERDRIAAHWAGAMLWRKDLSPEERVYWTRVHAAATAPRQPSNPTDLAREHMERFGTVSLSEDTAPALDPDDAADRIVAAVNGNPLPPLPEDPADRERARRAAKITASAAEHSRLVELAEGLTHEERKRAAQLLSLERADESGALDFGLSAQERAAAELLLDEEKDRARMRDIGRRLDERAAELRQMADRRLNL